MPTYRQDTSYIEDGHGEVIVRIICGKHSAFLLDDGDITSVQFLGVGLSDITLDGSGLDTTVVAKDYRVEIDSVGGIDTFKWSNDGGSTYVATTVAMSGSPQTLENSITIDFAATTGHTLADAWEFSTIKDVDIFDVSDISKKIVGEFGGITESVLSVNLNEAKISTDDEENCKDFVREAEDITVKRWIAVLFDPSVTPQKSEQVFSGLIQSTFGADEIKWGNVQWNSTIDPLSLWKFKAKPITQIQAEDMNLTDVIDKLDKEWNSSTQVWDDDTTWQDANVENKQAWFFKTVSGGDAVTQHYKLVSLDALLRRMANIYQQLHINEGYGDLTITFTGSLLNYTFHPIRYNHVLGMPAGSRPRWIWVAFRADGGTNSFPDLIMQQTFKNPAESTDNYDEVAIDPDNDLSKDSIYLSYLMLKEDANTGKLRIPQQLQTENMRWENLDNIETFFDLIFYLGWNLGIIIEIVYTTNTNIDIRFFKSTAISAGTIYVRDADSSSLQIKSDLVDSEKNKLIGMGTPLTHAGYAKISVTEDKNIGTYTNWLKAGNVTNNLLLSISPQVYSVYATYGGISEFGHHYNDVTFPVNTVFKLGGTYDSAITKKSNMQHSGMYIEVSQRAGETSGDEPATYFAMVGGITVNVDGTDVFYNKIDNFITALRVRNADKYIHTRTLKQPYINGFNDSASATGAKWSKLNLRNVIDIDNKEWIVEEIKYTLNPYTVEIKLIAIEKYEDVTPGTPDGITAQENMRIDPLPERDNYINSKVVSANVDKFSILYLNPVTGLVEPVDQTNPDHLNNIYGIALNSATLSGNESVFVQTRGNIVDDEWTAILGFTPEPGQPLFLNSVQITNGFNFHVESQDPVNNEIYCYTGEFTASNVFSISEGFQEQYKYRL